MRLLRRILNWGRCPQTPGIFRFSARMGQWRKQIAPLPPIPAAESALGVRSRSALSSAQVLPEWTTLASPCNKFLSNGDNPLTHCLTPGVHFTATVVPSSHPPLVRVPVVVDTPSKDSTKLPLASLQLLCAKAGRSMQSRLSVSIVITDVKNFTLTSFIVDISFYAEQRRAAWLARK